MILSSHPSSSSSFLFSRCLMIWMQWQLLQSVELSWGFTTTAADGTQKGKLAPNEGLLQMLKMFSLIILVIQ